MQRPTHLESRQQTGAAFSEDAVLITLTGTRDGKGRWVTDPNPTETPIRVSTEVNEAEEREVTEGVAKKRADRTFFTATGIDPRTTGLGGENIQASQIRWNGLLWRVTEVGRWRWGFRLGCVLMDPQPE